MQTKDLKIISDRIPTRLKDTEREASQMIEEDCDADAAIASNLSGPETEIRVGHGMPQEEVFGRYGV